MKKMKIEFQSYESQRFDYFNNLLEKAIKKHNRIFGKYSEASVLSDEYRILCDSALEVKFLRDVVELLRNKTI